jgi:AcrR family transcriptional regulator
MTTDASASHPITNLRADARRNRGRILAAARDVFVELGSEAPLDEIAARAEVGIGTLYRRFPDRRSLMRAVVLDVLERVAQEAALALSEEPDAAAALARYMHRALDLRVSAVVPALLGQVSLDDEELLRVRQRSAGLIEQMIDQAQADGTLRPDVAFGDIALMLTRMSRPLPGLSSHALDSDLAHRHLDLVLDGLLTNRARAVTSLPGPALTLGDLQALPSARHADND